MDLLARMTCDHIVGTSPTVQYTLQSCPRCLGKGSYGGFVYGTDGQLVTISGGAQLAQQITKILTENRRASGYGFNYDLLSGVIDPGRLSAIRGEVVRCLNYLQALQQAEKLRGFSYLPSEEINTIDSVQTVQDIADPRRIQVSVRVVAQSGKPVSAQTVLRR